MKKIVKALSLLLVALLLFSCVSCGEEEKEISKTYKSLREHLMAEGRVVTNFIRDMEFKYGDARINPAINWEFLDESKAINPDEKIVSCDRLVGWILYRVGFTSQPYDQGITVWPMPDWCEDMGFELITNLEELREGDIVFVNPDSQYRPAHVFMCASTMREDGRFLRYDAQRDRRCAYKRKYQNPHSFHSIYGYRLGTYCRKNKQSRQIPSYDSAHNEKLYRNVTVGTSQGAFSFYPKYAENAA